MSNPVQRDIDLTKSDDLYLFFEAVESVYADVMRYQSTAGVHTFHPITFGEISGEDVFMVFSEKKIQLQELINSCQTANVQISDAEVLRMQCLYDDMITLRNFVCSAYAESDVLGVLSDECMSGTTVKTSMLLPESEVRDIQEESLDVFRDKVRSELAQILKQKGCRGIRAKLDQTIGQATTKVEILAAKEAVLKIECDADEQRLSQVAENALSYKKRKQRHINHSLVSSKKPLREDSVRAANTEEAPLVSRYLTHPRYQSFIQRHYNTPVAFERLLETTITQIEARTVDVLERWLGERYESVFVLIKEMAVAEVATLNNNITQQWLCEKNVKYEMLVAWIDLIPDMQAVVGDSLQLPFGALFARWIAELEIQYQAQRENLAHNSQG